MGDRGLAKMPRIMAAAPGDIRHCLMPLYQLARRLLRRGAGRVVELGVRDGDTTRTLLAACEDESGTLYSWDIEEDRERVARKAAEHGLEASDAEWIFSCGDAAAAGVAWGHIPLLVDLVFIDTYHSYEQCRREIDAWFGHVRVGGAIALHDYYLTTPPEDGVRQAVDEFKAARPEDWTLATHWTGGHEGDTGLAVLERIR